MGSAAIGAWLSGARRRLRSVAPAAAAGACLIPGAAHADYPRVSKRIPANPNTYQVANRPLGGLFIDSVMIHDTEATYPATVSVFTNLDATGSVQYVVSGQSASSDPAVTQFVADKDWTFSVGNFWFNQHSIGVEHIGFAAAPAGYYTPLLYRRSADLVGWELWKYRIPIDRAHILGHDNIPWTVDPGVQLYQHWDPGPSWDWPYYMKLVLMAYARWSHGAAPPPPEIPRRFRSLGAEIRTISAGSGSASEGDVLDWSSGREVGFASVYADRNGRPDLNVLVRGASDPSTYVPSPNPTEPPAHYNHKDWSCDNFPWAMVPLQSGTVISPVASADERAKAAWGEEFALLGRRRVGEVLYDKINFSGTTGWIRDSLTSGGWGALLRFRGAPYATTLYSVPEYPGVDGPRKDIDTRICSDTAYGFSRGRQTYVSQLVRRSQGRTWYQIDYNHRVAWVPADEVSVTRP